MMGLSHDIVLVLLILIVGCKKSVNPLDSGGKKGVEVEVLDKAGSQQIWTPESGVFRPVRSPMGLPAPGFFGFLSNANAASANNQEVLVLGADLTEGRIEVIPIGLVRYQSSAQEGESILLIAVPADSSIRTVTATTFRAFLIEYDALKQTIEIWVRHARGFNSRELLRWEDEKAAQQIAG